MNYEKKYKEALEVARVAAFNGHQSLMEGIFPELKESEDERIRKELIDIVKKSPITFAFEDKGKVLAWLEKQGEQKPADEPKFNIGDWVISTLPGIKYPHLITDIKDGYYIFGEDDDHAHIASNDNILKLWTIADAKDGDVLATLDYILIFEKIFSKDYGVSHCHYGFGNTTPQFNFNKDDNWYFGKEANVYPATKEQRDLLFSKMHEAGYEWDEENKELKKIEQKPTNEPKFKIGDYIERKDGVGCHAKIIFVGGNFYGCEKLIYPEDESPFFEFMFENQDEFRVSSDFQQKPAWSEKDEKEYKYVLKFVDNILNNCGNKKDYEHSKRCYDWLKSLKQRIKKEAV